MKGIMHTVEAVMAVLIIFTSITMVYPIREKNDLDLGTIGQQCLQSLDNEGKLKYYASNDMDSDLDQDLRDCIPQIIDFTFKICDSSVCNPDSVPDEREIFTANYLMSGYESYEAENVNVWLWLK